MYVCDNQSKAKPLKHKLIVSYYGEPIGICCGGTRGTHSRPHKATLPPNGAQTSRTEFASQIVAKP